MTDRKPTASDFTTLGANATTRDGATTWWFAEPSADVAQQLADRHISVDRRLHQMRVALPLSAPPPAPTRPFVQGRDDHGVLRVNNEAFDWHPEQGGWTESDLHERMGESWFDPEAFRILDVDNCGSVDGFCWMKPHHGPPAMAEIYVIALGTAMRGRGLGGPLAAAGLDWAARNTEAEQAMLYVEADNEPAVKTYIQLGFSIHHTDLGVSGPGPD